MILGTNYWRNRVLKVAQDYKDKIAFAVSNKNDFSHELDEYGLAEKKSSDKPVVAGMGKDGEKYPMTEEFRLIFKKISKVLSLFLLYVVFIFLARKI